MNGDTVATLFNDPKTLGSLAEADAVGQEGIPGLGPYMTMYVKFQGDVVQHARFETYGCPYAVACGSWVTRWVVGRTVEQARALESSDLGLLIGGLPLGREHCASLAVLSLRKGLDMWQERHKSSGEIGALL